jgi:hypothetical protein
MVSKWSAFSGRTTTRPGKIERSVDVVRKRGLHLPNDLAATPEPTYAWQAVPFRMSRVNAAHAQPIAVRCGDHPFVLAAQCRASDGSGQWRTLRVASETDQRSHRVAPSGIVSGAVTPWRRGTQTVRVEYKSVLYVQGTLAYAYIDQRIPYRRSRPSPLGRTSIVCSFTSDVANNSGFPAHSRYTTEPRSETTSAAI